MFDLSNALKDWRRDFTKKCDLPTKRIDEIEAHLLDTIDELSDSHSEEEAFNEALKRLGDSESLIAEYKKNHTLIHFDYFGLWLSTAILIICACYFLHGLYLAWELRDFGMVFKAIGPLIGFSISILQFLGTYSIFRTLWFKAGGVGFDVFSKKCATLLLQLIVSLYGFMLLMVLIKTGFSLPNELFAYLVAIITFIAGIGSLYLISDSNRPIIQIGQICLLFTFIPCSLHIVQTWNRDPSPTVALLVVFLIPIIIGIFGAMLQKSVDEVELPQKSV